MSPNSDAAIQIPALVRRRTTGRAETDGPRSRRGIVPGGAHWMRPRGQLRTLNAREHRQKRAFGGS